MKAVIFLLACLLPWPLRRVVLSRLLHYQLHPTSRMGWCVILPRKLIMDEGSSIGHLTVCRGIDLLHLKPHSAIGRLNWITGHPSGSTDFFREIDRNPELIMNEHSAITNRHLIDCTATITIGRFTTVAGYRSQLVTHSIDLGRSRQSASAISIGAYCFIGTDCVLLGGSSLPDYSVLAAKSLLNRDFTEQYFLYGGVPSTPIRALAADLLYFHREFGIVN